MFWRMLIYFLLLCFIKLLYFYVAERKIQAVQGSAPSSLKVGRGSEPHPTGNGVKRQSPLWHFYQVLCGWGSQSLHTFVFPWQMPLTSPPQYSTPGKAPEHLPLLSSMSLTSNNVLSYALTFPTSSTALVFSVFPPCLCRLLRLQSRAPRTLFQAHTRPWLLFTWTLAPCLQIHNPLPFQTPCQSPGALTKTVNHFSI